MAARTAGSPNATPDDQLDHPFSLGDEALAPVPPDRLVAQQPGGVPPGAPADLALLGVAIGQHRGPIGRRLVTRGGRAGAGLGGQEALVDHVDDRAGRFVRGMAGGVDLQLGIERELVLDIDPGNPRARLGRPRVDAGRRRAARPRRLALPTYLQRAEELHLGEPRQRGPCEVAPGPTVRSGVEDHGNAGIDEARADVDQGPVHGLALGVGVRRRRRDHAPYRVELEHPHISPSACRVSATARAMTDFPLPGKPVIQTAQRHRALAGWPSRTARQSARASA